MDDSGPLTAQNLWYLEGLSGRILGGIWGPTSALWLSLLGGGGREGRGGSEVEGLGHQSGWWDDLRNHMGNPKHCPGFEMSSSRRTQSQYQNKLNPNVSNEQNSNVFDASHAARKSAEQPEAADSDALWVSTAWNLEFSTSRGGERVLRYN